MNLHRLINIINADFKERSSILNLNASENHMSIKARQILAEHPAYDCYEFPPSGGQIDGPWRFSGEPYNEAILDLISEQTKTLFGTPFVNVRARGGQAAEIGVLLGLSHGGDHVFYVAESDGGHFGLTEIANRTNIHLCPISFNIETHQIDIEATLNEMGKYWQTSDRKLMIVNQSFILQQQSWEHIIPALKSIYPDLIISVDGSHLLGLIAGNVLKNPLTYGADILHASTHKTFPGPQKAMILFNQQLDKQFHDHISSAISPLLQSSCGTAEIMSLAYVLAEMQQIAHSYALATCAHAKCLAQQLDQECSMVGEAFGFTETHQCWLSIGDEVDAWHAYAKLHAAGLRALPAFLPYIQQWGIRFGSNALTRRGLKDKEFCQIANWIADVLHQRKSPSTIRKSVAELAHAYPLDQLNYSLSPNLSAVIG